MIAGTSTGATLVAVTIMALGTGAALAMAPHPVPAPADPAVEAAAQAHAAEALMALSARVREVASLVAEQAVVHRGLRDLDWHGPAAALFAATVSSRAAALDGLARAFEQLSDDALRRAQQIGGGW